MGEMDRLVSILAPKGDQELVDLKFFPGEEQVTVEEFCVEAHSAFVQVDSGQSPALREFPEKLTCVSIERFLTD